MKGTEKQIKWAADIKRKIYGALDTMGAMTSRKAEYDSFRGWLDGKDDASWWIESWQLTRTEHMFLRKAMKEYKSM